MDLIAEARPQLDRVRGLCRSAGLRYLDLDDGPIGVGIALAWSDTDFVVLSVSAGGNEHQLAITSGVLRNIQQERLAALDWCNQRTRDNTAFPVFLHDAQAGWDILTQVTYPIDLLVQAPDFFAAIVPHLPNTAREARQEAVTERGLQGDTYRWDEQDVNRLLLRAMM